MRIWFFLLIGMALLCSCGGNNVPGDIIPKEKMQTIIWQLMQSDEYVNGLVVRDSTKKSSTERMKRYQQVFDLNKTTLEDFKKSYKFYINHPEITKPLFDSIAANAVRERTELFKPKPTDSTSKQGMERFQLEKKRQDSITKANTLKQTISPKMRDSIQRHILKPTKMLPLKADSAHLRRKK